MAEKDLAEAVKQGMREYHADTEHIHAYWDRAFEHFWSRAWSRVTSTAGKWLIAAIASGGAGWIGIQAVKHGWIK